MHRVLDGEFMQTEHIADGLHLVLVWLVQTDPHERVLALGFELMHLVQRCGVGVLTRQPLAVDVDRAVDHRPRDGDMDGLGFGMSVLGPRWSKGRRQCAPERRHRFTSSQRRPNSAADNATRGRLWTGGLRLTAVR